jgi:hypothetical protein
VLDVPAASTGDGGQLGLRIDGHRKSDRLQHRQIAGRVGIGDGFGQVEPFGLRQVGQHQGPGLADGGEVLEPTRVAAVALAQAGAHDVVEEGAEGLDHDVGTVRCPRARCSLTLAIPAGKDLASSRWWKSSQPSSARRPTGAPS